MKISLSGIKEFEGKLERIREVASSFEPELKDIGEWFINFETNEVFETEGGVIGETWADLSHPYKEHKAGIYKKPPKPGITRSSFPGRKKLVRTGFMRTHWKLYTTAQYALITNQADYAKYHQFGTSKIPQRVFVKIDEERKRTITSMFAEGVLKRIQDAFK